MTRLTVCMIAVALFSVSQSALGGASGQLGGGNLLISTNEVLYEYTREGSFVQSFTIPNNAGEPARDIVANGPSTVFVYNGTIDPVLSILDVPTRTWSHMTHQGWATFGNGTYGGIAVRGQYVFVTDMTEGGDSGIVRFDVTSGTSELFAGDIAPIDLTIGLNGLLYALHPGGSPGGREVEVYDPLTLSYLRTIDLAAIFGHTAHRSIAVNASGEMFIADWDGDMQKIDEEGNILLETNICGIGESCSLYDVDVSSDGAVVVGDRSGGVIVTDEMFSEFSAFAVGGSGIFVAFEPCGGCPADVDGSENVRVPDLIVLLGCWGTLSSFDPACPCLDADGNGDIDVPDLIEFLGKWGSCP